MAQSASSSKTTGKDADAEQLGAQMEQLKDDIARISETLRAMAEESGQEAKARVARAASALRDRSRELASGVADELHEFEARTTGAVRERPLTALAIAAGAGLLIGLLSSRR